MLGIIMQQAGAFLDLATCLRNRLAHFGHGKPGQFFLIAFVKIAERGEQPGSLVQRSGAPVAIGARGGFQLAVDTIGIEGFVCGDRFAGCGIGCGDHGGGPLAWGYTQPIATPPAAFRALFPPEAEIPHLSGHTIIID